MTDNNSSELNDRVAPYNPPLGDPRQPADAAPGLEPWSHPWLDQLGLRYHQAIAEKIRRRPDLLETAMENIRRWNAAEPDETPSQARREWHRILEQTNIEEILRLMTDPTEAGHRRRQSSPFAGILAPDESRAIRDQFLSSTL